jgi:putative NADH-flavin reductase
VKLKKCNDRKGMEGWGVMKIMEDLKNRGWKVTRVVHDKDSSTMRNVMVVYEDVQECLCLSV